MDIQKFFFFSSFFFSFSFIFFFWWLVICFGHLELVENCLYGPRCGSMDHELEGLDMGFGIGDWGFGLDGVGGICPCGPRCGLMDRGFGYGHWALGIGIWPF